VFFALSHGVQVRAVHDKQMKKIVNVPKNTDVVMVVPLGYSASKTAFRQARSRMPLKEICYLEEYGRKL
jgi:hypothetical protein